MGIYQDIIKISLVTFMKKEGKKLRERDADNDGTDDAGGRSLEAIAEAVETIDFDNLQDAKSLKNIGIALEAAGKKLQQEATKAKLPPPNRVI